MQNRLLNYVFTSLFLLCLMFACKQKTETKTETTDSVKTDNKSLALMQKNCFSCHNMDTTSNMRVAPPMYNVREHYLTGEITRSAFIEKMVQFVNNPTEQNSMMPGAVRNFGLMPKLMYNEEDLKLIAGYIYDNNLSSPEWLAQWNDFKKTARPTTTYSSYKELGLSIANGTKSELGKNLLAAIQQHGPEGAVEFCNTRALPLTDSMSNVYHATVKRVTDKPRNKKNKANADEMAYIEELKKLLADNGKPAPKLFAQNGKMIGYYPIVTNKMCLQCHGKQNQDINAATLTKISKLYSDDKATGYSENEIRGLYVVEMDTIKMQDFISN